MVGGQHPSLFSSTYSFLKVQFIFAFGALQTWFPTLHIPIAVPTTEPWETASFSTTLPLRSCPPVPFITNVCR